MARSRGQMVVARSLGLLLPLALLCATTAPAQSLDDLRAAADAGSGSAQLDLGTRLLALGSDESWAEGISWLEKAARGGAPVYILIADSWAEGIGVPRDPARAAEWYRIGAETGDGLAQYEIGRRYLEGDGVEIDMIRAVFYLELALARLDDDTRRAAAEDTLVRARWWTTREDQDKIRRMVRTWKPRPLPELIN